MRTGLLEKVLMRRFGQPVLCIDEGLAAKSWDGKPPNEQALLYVGMKWHGLLGARYASLREIYGNAFGGYLLKNSLKVAVLVPREVYGLWNIDELRMLPAVQHAQVLDPAIDYFMDAANVWYYGHKAGELWVYDTTFDELDCPGPIEPALEELMEQWDAAGQPD
jgi:hypothetical protein